MSYEFCEPGPNGPRKPAHRDKGFPTALGLVESFADCSHVSFEFSQIVPNVADLSLGYSKTLQIFVRHRYAPRLLQRTFGLTTSPIGTVNRPMKLIAAGMAETMPTTRP